MGGIVLNRLYYGNGTCTIEGAEIRLVYIKYKGAIEIDDKTSSSFVIGAKNNRIIIAPLKSGTLNELFDYVGEFKITSVITINKNGDKERPIIKRVMDYTELLNTNSEATTTKSEDLSSTHISGRKIAKTILKQPYVPNLNTSTNNVDLYLEDGTQYSGDFHIHLADNASMTGSEHTEESQDLYYSTGKPTRNKGLPYGVIEQRNRKKIQARKVRRRR